MIIIDKAMSLLGYHKSASTQSGSLSRDYEPQGKWTSVMDGFVPRRVQPQLYEALREAIPLVDSIINRLVTLDGILKIEAESDQLQNQIQDWMDNVQVNDLQHGLQNFYSIQSNELYEQGLTIGQFVLDEKLRDVVRLNVGDSKGILFNRPEKGSLETWYGPPATKTGRRDGTDPIESILRGTLKSQAISATRLRELKFRKVDPESMIYAAYNVEADNPYGVSLLRSTEFVSKILLTIENATEQTWARFGDPIFEVVYKTNNKLASEKSVLEERRETIASVIAAAIKGKRQGKSMDIVHAVGKDDTIEMNIVGAGGEVLEMEQPVRHMEEQILGKSGLPGWMVGRTWSTSERLAQRQGELVLQESRTRFTNRQQGLSNIVATALRARGTTWKPGDWQLVQELPSLQDLVAKAQAGFLEAQTELMRSGGAPQEATAETDTAGKTMVHLPTTAFDNAPEGVKGLGEFRSKAEGFAESNPALPKLENATVEGLVKQWQSLYQEVIDALDLAVNDESMIFAYDDLIMTPKMQKLERELIKKMSETDPVLANKLHEAWMIGVENGSAELGADNVVAGVVDGMRDAIYTDSLSMIKNTEARILKNDIVAALQDSEYDGLNTNDVARSLKQRFDIHNYDWERLARSEISIAQAKGKMEQYSAHDIAEYNYRHSKDGKVSAVCRRLAAGGPYKVGKGPLPVEDSHPNCRCTVVSFVRDEG